MPKFFPWWTLSPLFSIIIPSLTFLGKCIEILGVDAPLGLWGCNSDGYPVEALGMGLSG